MKVLHRRSRRREIRISAHLQPLHILTLIDSGEAAVPGAAPLLYYVVPYVEGESLRARLTREGRLAPSDALRILQDVLHALAHAHAQGIVHREPAAPDLAPSSDRLWDRGTCKYVLRCMPGP